MTRFVDGAYEPDQADVSVHVVVPEEFVGSAVAALITRRGYVKGAVENESRGYGTIRAWFPASEYASLVEAITSETRGRGKVERDY